jgi:hypothetical protein
MYYVARWYDVEIGHFVQADTIVPDEPTSFSWNRFAYSLYSPLMYIDPDGHDPLTFFIAMLGLLVFMSQIPSDVPQAGAGEYCGPPDCGDPAIMALGLNITLTAPVTSVMITSTAAETAMYAGSQFNGTPVGNLFDTTSTFYWGASTYNSLYGTNLFPNPAHYASQWQGSGDYPGVDNWSNVTLEPGTIVWGGAPGQGNFYTDNFSIQGAGNDARVIFGGMQVGTNERFPDFRNGLTAYYVNQETLAGFSIAQANPQWGYGGYYQYFIQDYDEVLDPFISLPLINWEN